MQHFRTNGYISQHFPLYSASFSSMSTFWLCPFRTIVDIQINGYLPSQFTLLLLLQFYYTSTIVIINVIIFLINRHYHCGDYLMQKHIRVHKRLPSSLLSRFGFLGAVTTKIVQDQIKPKIHIYIRIYVLVKRDKIYCSDLPLPPFELNWLVSHKQLHGQSPKGANTVICLIIV